MDKEKIEQGVRLILEGLGEDVSREGLEGTPRRIAEMYEEIFAGLKIKPVEVLTVTFAENHDEMVLLKGIPLFSICEQHLMPFVGQAHVAYIPGEDGRVTGISKLARVVEVASKRPQLQERLTTDIANALVEALNPAGVLIVVEAEHLCLSMRDVQKTGTIMVTSAVRGIFRTNKASRAEALSLVKEGEESVS
ncbi:MAG: GTP cyclohydrolase I FolE [Candidatus Subteraquimicrobiales bacterium]|nr:GTP cyclohydrolase I FolE [Candidatus Subteraquimicrobiales bacterium]